MEKQDVTLVVVYDGDKPIERMGRFYRGIVDVFNKNKKQEIEDYKTNWTKEGFKVAEVHFILDEEYGWTNWDVEDDIKLPKEANDAIEKIDWSVETTATGGCETCGWGGYADFSEEYEGPEFVPFKTSNFKEGV